MTPESRQAVHDHAVRLSGLGSRPLHSQNVAAVAILAAELQMAEHVAAMHGELTPQQEADLDRVAGVVPEGDVPDSANITPEWDWRLTLAECLGKSGVVHDDEVRGLVESLLDATKRLRHARPHLDRAATEDDVPEEVYQAASEAWMKAVASDDHNARNGKPWFRDKMMAALRAAIAAYTNTKGRSDEA